MGSSRVPGDTVITTQFYDLCLYLGGSPDSFIGMLLTLWNKADMGNRAILAAAYPRVTAAHGIWMRCAPLTWETMDALVEQALTATPRPDAPGSLANPLETMPGPGIIPGDR